MKILRWVFRLSLCSQKCSYNLKRSHKERTRDLWNTRRDIQIQTKPDQPPWKIGQHQTAETRPQLQTPRTKRSWTPQQTMAMRRCRNRSNDLIHGERWWWWWWWLVYQNVAWNFLSNMSFLVISATFTTFSPNNIQFINIILTSWSPEMYQML